MSRVENWQDWRAVRYGGIGSMNTLRKAALVCLVGLLGACTTTNDAMNRVSHYYDRNVDDFFRANGMPSQAYQFQNGEKVFRWSSAVRSVYMPPITTFTGTVGPLGQVSGSAHTSGGFSTGLQCVLDLHTNKENRIIKIVPVVDTWGAWETSRCNETLR